MSCKNKSSYKSFQSRKKRFHQLEPGLSGFLCTCNSKLKEKDCVREAYNILNEFGDKLFGPEKDIFELEKEDSATERNETADDISDLLKKEVDSIKEKLNRKVEQRRFQAIQSGANGVVFIRTTVPDPVKLAHTIVTSLSNVQKSKFLLRLLPVEITCKAYLDDICKACNSLFDNYFSGSEKTFTIIFNHRNNNTLKRDDVIGKVAELVFSKNEKNKTDLKHPQLAVLIEVIRNICCISVVPDFYVLKKYNLIELVAKNLASNEAELKKGDDALKNL